MTDQPSSVFYQYHRGLRPRADAAVNLAGAAAVFKAQGNQPIFANALLCRVADVLSLLAIYNS